MKISVIIPTYNRAHLIKNSIDSVLNQTIKVDEIIVIDDGSSDNTKEFLDNYPTITYHYQKNSGVSGARNAGIKLAKNDWICFLDSDDIWHENKIEQQIIFHQEHSDIFFSFSDEKWIFNGKNIKQKKHQLKINKKTFTDHLENTFIGASTVIIHKSIFLDIGLFDTQLKACEDYDLWLRILRKYEVGYIDFKLIDKIAGHQGQLSFETPMMDQYRIKALLKHLNSKHSIEVKKILIKKCEILIVGAIKHNNKTLQEYCEKILLKLL